MPSKLFFSFRRIRRVDLSSYLAIALSCGLSGCGGTNEPPVSEANRLFLEAQELRAQGNTDGAIEKLAASIAAEPTLWAFTERAKLHAQAGNDRAAIEDCDAALKTFPDEPDLLWLKGELQKPKEQRFQGRFKTPPSANR